MNVKGLQTTDIRMANGSLDGMGDSAIGAQKGVLVLDESLMHGFVIDSLKGTEIAGGGIFAEASCLQPRFVVGDELAGESSERHIWLATKRQEMGETTSGTGIVLGYAEVTVLALMLCFALHESKKALVLFLNLRFHG